MSWLLIQGDARRIPLADHSVQCCVTSPPYWGLRDYGVAGQLGLEPTPETYVARMVEVFREVRRVLRDDGVLFCNMGDSYAGGKTGRGDADRPNSQDMLEGKRRFCPKSIAATIGNCPRDVPPGLKPKDLCGIPWRLAFALQADGWYLRSDIIWHKPNPMPESVRDRPTKAHEYVFLMSKSERYFWDQEAVREEQTGDTRGRMPCVATKMAGTVPGLDGSSNEQRMNGHRSHMEIPGGRNIRSVWTITPKPFKGAHFATFPPALVERCIKAGTSERGCCPQCGKAWERVVETKLALADDGKTCTRCNKNHGHARVGSDHMAAQAYKQFCCNETVSLGFRPSCSCPDADPVPCIVLDPFVGSGTTAAVAQSLGRDCIGIDLNPAYLAMSRRRIERPHATVVREVRDSEALPLFRETQP